MGEIKGNTIFDDAGFPPCLAAFSLASFLPILKCVDYTALPDLRDGPRAGHKACASLTKLGERYDRERLENACGRILAYSNCPFNPSESPCNLELDLIIMHEAERGSLEIFYALREELHFYLKRTLLLESILAENSIPIPKYDD